MRCQLYNDFPPFFSKAVINFINQENGRIEKETEITGAGKKNIHIFVTQRLPKSIFDDFMCLCETGMVGGDQSFSEYLILKGKVPYYNMQYWQWELGNAIWKLTGDEIKNTVSQRIISKA